MKQSFIAIDTSECIYQLPRRCSKSVFDFGCCFCVLVFFFHANDDFDSKYKFLMKNGFLMRRSFAFQD